MLELLSLWASDQSARRMVLSDNAAKLYGFDT